MRHWYRVTRTNKAVDGARATAQTHVKATSARNAIDSARWAGFGEGLYQAVHVFDCCDETLADSILRRTYYGEATINHGLVADRLPR